jgi:hypothetical protein
MPTAVRLTLKSTVAGTQAQDRPVHATVSVSLGIVHSQAADDGVSSNTLDVIPAS